MPKVTEAYLEERRQHILDAATRCFARKGFHQTTMEDIGREAGLSPTVAYRYFDGKEDIIIATIGHSADRLAQLLEATQRVEDIPLLFEQMIVDFYQRLEEPGRDIHYRVRILLWAETVQNPRVAERALIRRQEAQMHLTRLVENGQDQGQIRRDLDPSAVAGAYMASLDGLVLHWLADPNIDNCAYRDAHIAMVRGLFNHRE
jgi:TetR/AcrR family transcriptional repressor of uid operon